jgi:hypothetical protein
VRSESKEKSQLPLFYSPERKEERRRGERREGGKEEGKKGGREGGVPFLLEFR